MRSVSIHISFSKQNETPYCAQKQRRQVLYDQKRTINPVSKYERLKVTVSRGTGYSSPPLPRPGHLPTLASPPASNSQRGEGHSWVELLLLADPPSVHLVLVKATARHDKGDCGQLPKRIHAYPVQTVLPMCFDSPARPVSQPWTTGFTRRARRKRQPPRLTAFPSAPWGLPLQIIFSAQLTRIIRFACFVAVSCCATMLCYYVVALSNNYCIVTP